MTDIEHSDTACAANAGMTLDAAMLSARAAIPGNRVVTMLIPMQSPLLKVSSVQESCNVGARVARPSAILCCSGADVLNRRSDILLPW
ncbi:hypothetical protein [Bradyrhizobium sp. 27S5]|uniref:hypothetical protein n=1 Tax=Bradyrhizobium sp. 27S5 TaxID=3139728 RepID=UPI0030D47C48